MTDYSIKDKVAIVGIGDPHQEIKIGADVKVVWEDHEDVTLAQWRQVSQ